MGGDKASRPAPLSIPYLYFHFCQERFFIFAFKFCFKHLRKKGVALRLVHKMEYFLCVGGAVGTVASEWYEWWQSCRPSDVTSLGSALRAPQTRLQLNDKFSRFVKGKFKCNEHKWQVTKGQVFRWFILSIRTLWQVFSTKPLTGRESHANWISYDDLAKD